MLIKIIANISLLLAFGMLILWLVRRDKNKESSLSLDDLLKDDVTGKTSKTAFVFLASFVLTSWVIVYMTARGLLTLEWYTLYMVNWVAPAVVKIFKGGSAPAIEPPKT